MKVENKAKKSMDWQRKFLCCFVWIIGLAAFVLLVLAFVSIRCESLKICFSHFYSLAQLFIIAFSLSIAVKTYHWSIKVDEANMLINLRNLLNSKSNVEIHKKLLGQYDPKDSNHNSRDDYDSFWETHKAEVYNYLGSLELMDIMLEDGTLDEEDFKNQFVYRIEEVFDYRNKGIQSLFDSDNEKKYWKHLLALKEKYIK